MKIIDAVHFGPIEIVIKSNPKKIDMNLRQFAFDLVEMRYHTKTDDERDAIDGAIKLLDGWINQIFLSPQGEPMFGICHDCGAATALIPLSTIAETGFIPQMRERYEGDTTIDFWYCGYCGSNHVTIRKINFEDVWASEVIYDD
jgi:hypothetical protein